MLRLRDHRLAGSFFSAIGFFTLLWAGQQSGPASVELAAVKDNGCSVTAGNGKVVTQPAGNCPIDIRLGNVLTTSGGAAHSLAPGDTAFRPVDVTNVGNTAFDGLQLKTQPAGTLGARLRLTVKRCSAPWTASTTGWTCAGSTSVLLMSGPASQSSLVLAGSPATAKNGVDRLLVGVTVDGSTPNTLQGASATMTYTFTAVRKGGAGR